MSTETLVVPDDFTPLDRLLFRRYRVEVPGLLEQTLDLNPGLAELGPYLPRGRKVLVQAPTPESRKPVRETVRLYD